MFARVVRWEGGDPEALKKSAADIRAQAEGEEGPPPGVPAKELLLFQDLENGKALAVTLFETEEDYRQGDETLSSMNPPGDGLGKRVSVDRYELAAHFKA